MPKAQSKKWIVIIEDEIDLLDNYVAMLKKQGYEVSGYTTKIDAQQALRENLPDLVILDIALQEDNDAGFELCRKLRAQSEQLPIIFLTARNNDVDTISGLRLGADDYLTKDISLQHLIARISALFRRTEALQFKQQTDYKNLISVDDKLRINLDKLEVFWQDKKLDLTITELWILKALVEHPGHVKSREQLMIAANTLVDDNTITAQIKRIRNKFYLLDRDFNCIESIYGAGYRWQCSQS